MASKKGIVVTAIILAAITGASFLLWLVPQDGGDTTFVVTDYENYLDGKKNIHEVLSGSIEIEFESLRNGEITPEEYMTTTEVTASQITAQISEFVTSKPPEQWQESYINYMDGMKKFNSYIGETKVLANLIENGASQEEMQETIEKIESLKSESLEFIKKSDESRPNT